MQETPHAQTPTSAILEGHTLGAVDRLQGERYSDLKTDEATRKRLIDKAHTAALEENQLRTDALTSQARELLKPESPLTSEERAQLEAAVVEATRRFVELKQLVTELDTKYPIHSQPELAIPTIDLSKKVDVDAFIQSLLTELKKIPTDKLIVLVKNGVRMADFLPENFDFKLPESISSINTHAFGELTQTQDVLSANHSLVANAVSELFQRKLAEIAFSPSSTENTASTQNQSQMLEELAKTAREIYPNLNGVFVSKFKEALMKAYGTNYLAPSVVSADLGIALKLLGMSFGNASESVLEDLGLASSDRKDKILVAIKAVLSDDKLAYLLDKTLAGTDKNYHLGRFGGAFDASWTAKLNKIANHFDLIEAARKSETKPNQS